MVRLLAKHKKSTARPKTIIIDDPELGSIKLIRNDGRYIRIRVRTNSEIVVSAPRSASMAQIESFIAESHDSVKQSLEKIGSHHKYKDGDIVGMNHQLVVKTGARYAARITDTEVAVYIPDGTSAVQREQMISKAIAKALKAEAQHYLPKRLRYLALKHGYKYDRVRLTFAKTRWGSCSSTGTISLNVALMTLPTVFIDYVLMHELTHTIHMNHGVNFWQDLEEALPGASELDQELKNYSPYL